MDDYRDEYNEEEEVQKEAEEGEGCLLPILGFIGLFLMYRFYASILPGWIFFIVCIGPLIVITLYELFN